MDNLTYRIRRVDTCRPCFNNQPSINIVGGDEYRRWIPEVGVVRRCVAEDGGGGVQDIGWVKGGSCWSGESGDTIAVVIFLVVRVRSGNGFGAALDAIFIIIQIKEYWFGVGNEFFFFGCS